MRVLVVEDDLPLRIFLQVLIRRSGIEVDAIPTGENALDAIKSEEYATVILDLMLPGVSGFDILRSLRVTHPHLLRRIIVVTAVAQAALDQRFEFQSLIWQLFRKPFEVGELVATIEECTKFHSTVWPAPEKLSTWLEQRSADGGAKACLIATVANGKELRLHASCGFEPDMLEKHFPMPLSAGYPICAAVRTGRPVWLASVANAAIDFPLLSPVWRAAESRALAVVPLKRHELISGAMGWSFSEPQRFDDCQRAYFLDVANDCLPMVPVEQRGGYLQIS
jgi:CheY-like chemotaxis protein